MTPLVSQRQFPARNHAEAGAPARGANQASGWISQNSSLIMDSQRDGTADRKQSGGSAGRISDANEVVTAIGELQIRKDAGCGRSVSDGVKWAKAVRGHQPRVCCDNFSGRGVHLRGERCVAADERDLARRLDGDTDRGSHRNREYPNADGREAHKERSRKSHKFYGGRSCFRGSLPGSSFWYSQVITKQRQFVKQTP